MPEGNFLYQSFGETKSPIPHLPRLKGEMVGFLEFWNEEGIVFTFHTTFPGYVYYEWPNFGWMQEY